MNLKLSFRGISPVIATVVLIMIVVTLSLFVITWGFSFFDNYSPSPLECGETVFEAGVYQSSTPGEEVLEINNVGIKIDGFEVVVKNELFDYANSIELTGVFLSGESKSIEIDLNDEEANPLNDYTFTVIPILENEEGKLVSCTEEYGVIVSGIS